MALEERRCRLRPPIVTFGFASDSRRLPVRGRAREEGEKRDDEDQQNDVDAAVQFGGVGVSFGRHICQRSEVRGQRSEIGRPAAAGKLPGEGKENADCGRKGKLMHS